MTNKRFFRAQYGIQLPNNAGWHASSNAFSYMKWKVIGKIVTQIQSHVIKRKKEKTHELPADFIIVNYAYMD